MIAQHCSIQSEPNTLKGETELIFYYYLCTERTSEYKTHRKYFFYVFIRIKIPQTMIDMDFSKTQKKNDKRYSI